MKKKLFVNLFFLKDRNGMFFYAKDYLEKMEEEFIFIVRKDSDLAIKLKNYSKSVIEKKSFISLLIFFLKKENYFIFCPTPHPLPFINSQLIIFHDNYPFKGFVGLVKKFLLGASLLSSSTILGYINLSRGKEFCESLSCLTKNNSIYMPNKIPINSIKEKAVEFPNSIGLFGTSSIKKNYVTFFEEIFKSARNFKLYIYGVKNNSFEKLEKKFKNLDINFINQEDMDLDFFINSCEIIVSASRGEGFARPIAASILMKKKCFLIEDDIFREFYDGLAIFSDSIDGLVKKIIQDNGKPFKFDQQKLNNLLLRNNDFFQARRNLNQFLKQ